MVYLSVLANGVLFVACGDGSANLQLFSRHAVASWPADSLLHCKSQSPDKVLLTSKSPIDVVVNALSRNEATIATSLHPLTSLTSFRTMKFFRTSDCWLPALLYRQSSPIPLLTLPLLCILLLPLMSLRRPAHLQYSDCLDLYPDINE
ncbi:hypothetical protein K461DRAFT_9441 [Myriangium duriaei CBS 260.36]|uniref:Uncharacterized protein n=1 Tax=Myriangium duriaei CBS 260.36 TaxID=1168546 RepID=A0A9P4JAE0_9PEZI|nr:hypothetical protein K461DRAFT_9441 [Myriangium duriaei CBS 260.36]